MVLAAAASFAGVKKCPGMDKLIPDYCRKRMAADSGRHALPTASRKRKSSTTAMLCSRQGSRRPSQRCSPAQPPRCHHARPRRGRQHHPSLNGPYRHHRSRRPANLPRRRKAGPDSRRTTSPMENIMLRVARGYSQILCGGLVVNDADARLNRY
ncbi:hypothetical protein K438DRAFT_1809992 [Mycena galopus ATCC 62051]|nr:hypothetical protein K438DRAFT_1809992 [Mycena galopus ATCC 62051]